MTLPPDPLVPTLTEEEAVTILNREWDAAGEMTVTNLVQMGPEVYMEAHWRALLPTLAGEDPVWDNLSAVIRMQYTTQEGWKVR